MKNKILLVLVMFLGMSSLAYAGNDYTVTIKNNTKGSPFSLTLDQHQCTHSPGDITNSFKNPMNPGDSITFTWHTSDSFSQGCWDATSYIRILAGFSTQQGVSMAIDCNGDANGSHNISCDPDMSNKTNFCLATTGDDDTIAVDVNDKSSGNCDS